MNNKTQPRIQAAQDMILQRLGTIAQGRADAQSSDPRVQRMEEILTIFQTQALTGSEVYSLRGELAELIASLEGGAG